MSWDFNGTPSDGGGESITNPDYILQATKEISRGLDRKRAVRIKLLKQVGNYFYKISRKIDETPEVRGDLLNHLEHFEKLIVESTRLCISLNLSQNSSSISEIYETVEQLGIHLEAFSSAIYSVCSTNGAIFAEHACHLLHHLLQLCGERTESWLHLVMLSKIVLNIFNAFFDEDHIEYRNRWSEHAAIYIKPLAMAIYKCGDFCCQYFLLTLIHTWIQWVPASLAIPEINSAFSYIDARERKELFDSNVQVVRQFLNAMNMSPRGPKSIIPIQYLYLFTGGTQLNPPESVPNFEDMNWMDFSLGSGRFHCFYMSNDESFPSMNVRKDEIDSVCLNWVENDDHSESLQKLLFFHIILLPNTLGSRCCGGHSTIYVVFQSGKLVEEILRNMAYPQHKCGSRNCNWPKALRKLISQQKGFIYSQHWSPSSRVFDLNKSAEIGSEANTSTSTFINLTSTSANSSKVFDLNKSSEIGSEANTSTSTFQNFKSSANTSKFSSSSSSNESTTEVEEDMLSNMPERPRANVDRIHAESSFICNDENMETTQEKTLQVIKQFNLSLASISRSGTCPQENNRDVNQDDMSFLSQSSLKQNNGVSPRSDLAASVDCSPPKDSVNSKYSNSLSNFNSRQKDFNSQQSSPESRVFDLKKASKDVESEANTCASASQNLMPSTNVSRCSRSPSGNGSEAKAEEDWLPNISERSPTNDNQIHVKPSFKCSDENLETRQEKTVRLVKELNLSLASPSRRMCFPANNRDVDLSDITFVGQSTPIHKNAVPPSFEVSIVRSPSPPKDSVVHIDDLYCYYSQNSQGKSVTYSQHSPPEARVFDLKKASKDVGSEANKCASASQILMPSASVSRFSWSPSSTESEAKADEDWLPNVSERSQTNVDRTHDESSFTCNDENVDAAQQKALRLVKQLNLSLASIARSGASHQDNNGDVNLNDISFVRQSSPSHKNAVPPSLEVSLVGSPPKDRFNITQCGRSLERVNTTATATTFMPASQYSTHTFSDNEDTSQSFECAPTPRRDVSSRESTPTKIPATPVSVQDNIERSSSFDLSPIGSPPEGTLNITQSQKEICESRKRTCYSNAYSNSIKKQRANSNDAKYDHYDILTCSDDDFRNRMFPKVKTYARKQKPTLAEHRRNARHQVLPSKVPIPTVKPLRIIRKPLKPQHKTVPEPPVPKSRPNVKQSAIVSWLPQKYTSIFKRKW